MVSSDDESCPKCGGKLKYYGRVKRIVKTKWGITKHIYIRRLRCVDCGSIQRELPNYILPFKQYESEIIAGVIYGTITSEIIGFEDCPCEMTMSRWIKRYRK